MGSLERRLESLEARRKRRENQPTREALARLSDEDLEALEESLLAEARARGEQPPPTNELLERMKQLEIETIEQQRRR
jgi:cytochrome c553